MVTIERGFSEPRRTLNGRGDVITCPPPSLVKALFSGDPLRLLGDKLLALSLLPIRLRDAPEKRPDFGVEGRDGLFAS